MCIIIAAPAGVVIPKWELANSWGNNDDGAGFMYVDNGEIKIVKELANFDKYYKLYQTHLKVAFKNKSPMVLHFRIGTHGTVSLHNVHPFYVYKTNRRVAYCHNGTILAASQSPKYSDTVMFNKEFLGNLPDKFWLDRGILNLIGAGINNSKLVFLDVDRNLVIVNEDAGEQNSSTGTWYSNSSYRRTPTYTRYGVSCGTQFQLGDGYEDYDIPFGLTVEENKQTLAARELGEMMEHGVAYCETCGVECDLSKLIVRTHSSAELGREYTCADCYELEFIARSEFCGFCGKSIPEDDEGVIMDDNGAFCVKCSGILIEDGVISAAS